jgi:hypothetical protein
MIAAVFTSANFQPLRNQPSNTSQKMNWTKKCCDCGKVKRKDFFYRDVSTSANDKRARNCKKCCSIRTKKYKSKHRQKYIDYAKKYYRLNLSKFKSKRLMQCYGLTIEAFLDIVKSQNAACAICLRHHSKCPKGKGSGKKIRLYVDHDHATGKVRGLLCHNCNGRLDHLSTPELLRRSASYLEKHTSTNTRKEG